MDSAPPVMRGDCAHIEFVCLWTPTRRSTPDSCRPSLHPVTSGAADIMLGRRVAESRRAWPRHARLANALLARQIRARTGWPLRDLGPMRAVRREPLLALGLIDRRFGYPLEMVLRATTAGWRVAEVDVGYRQRIGNSKVTGTIEEPRARSVTSRGICRMTVLNARVLVLAKAPVVGLVKTRLCPPYTPEQAAALAAAALTDTLRAVGSSRASERTLVLDGRPEDGHGSRFHVVPQSSGGLDERIAAAFGGHPASRLPQVLVGMDTHSSPPHCWTRRSLSSSTTPSTPSSGRLRTAATGLSDCDAPTPTRSSASRCPARGHTTLNAHASIVSACGSRRYPGCATSMTPPTPDA